jgi:selenocysteine lyase/cysteine desulfurase
MPTRRDVLSALGLPLAASLTSACFSEPARRALEPFTDGPELTPEQVAADEARWSGLQAAFTVDRGVVNLNNGGCCPSPWSVQDAHKRRLDFSNQLPTHNLWQVLEPQRETSRAGLARMFGCDAEEIALTRNASESLETCLLGLDLSRGDEVLTSDQDYPRMLTALDQRARREGIVVHKVELPTPCEDEAEIVRRFEERLTPRTRLLLICHVINLNGQILPVRAIVQMARLRGVPTIVDGAHGFAHLLATRDELDVDYYGTSLHKWLLAPHGTGMLYVRREKLGDLWPLMAAPESMRENVRKFEEIGTHPAAQLVSICEALVFHHAIGSANKLARLRYLRDVWVARLRAASERVVLNTSLSPRFGAGFANFRIEGVDTAGLQAHLWSKHRILTTAILAPFPACTHGLRVTPNVYTTLEELERFGDVLEEVLAKGLPA